MPLRFQNLFCLHKLEYIKGKNSESRCVLCLIAKNDAEGVNLSVSEGRTVVVCVNKFPYNSGHLLIFPKRHITDYRELTGDEEDEISGFLKISLGVLDALYCPSGYNIGYNIGEFSGASVSHLHMHVIPRHRNELGFIDIVGGAKIVIEDPTETMNKLRVEFRKHSR